MPPNAGPSMVAVSPNQQPTMTMNGKGQMNSSQCSLRRSPSAFGGFGFGLQSMAASISSSSKPPLNLHHCAFGANSSSPTEAVMSKEKVLPIAVCPAPANQIELEFSLVPDSSSTPLQIQIHSPGGDFGQLQLDGTNQQSGTFCARQSNRCGHGQWQIRVLSATDGNLLEEMKLELDGVGRVHFFWNGRKLELGERDLLWMPGTLCCPLRLIRERENNAGK